MRANRDVEMCRVDDALPLKLNPDPVDARTREGQRELHLRAAIGDVRMRVDHVDEVVAGRQHVAPGAEVGLACPLPQQHLQPRLPHLEHDGQRDVGRMGGGFQL